MTAAYDTVLATKRTIHHTGRAFMIDPATVERGQELGLSPFAFYVGGRAGVLGDVGRDIVAAAFAFFPHDFIGRMWDEARGVMEPDALAEAYAEQCREWGRRVLAGMDGLDRFDDLAARIAGAADIAACPLFAGWRALPLPDDLPGRVSQRINVLREHRGGLHTIAVLAAGITPVEAALTGGGPDNARFTQWSEPFPEPRPQEYAEAEAAGDRLAARAYEALDAGELTEFAELCERVKATALAARA